MTPSPSPLPIVVAVIALAIVPACRQEWQWQCTTSQDCPPRQFCKLGACDPLHDGPIPYESTHQTPIHADYPDAYDFPDTDVDLWLEPQAPHPCPDAPAADADTLFLNEIFAYVPTGPEGDANQDGVRHAHDDEFLELVNISADTLDLTGVVLFNDTTPRFTFPPFCLEPLHAVVVFGGIEPGATLPEGDGWTSLIADSRFAYANGGGRVVVQAKNQETIADVTYGSHPAVALTRQTDLEPGPFLPHTDVFEEKIFSPGTCANGQPFRTGC